MFGLGVTTTGSDLRSSSLSPATVGSIHHNRTSSASFLSLAEASQSNSTNTDLSTPSTITMYDQTIVGPDYSQVNTSDCSALLHIYKSVSVNWEISVLSSLTTSTIVTTETDPATTNYNVEDVVTTSLYVSSGLTFGSLVTQGITTVGTFVWDGILTSTSYMVADRSYPFPSPCRLPDIDPSRCASIRSSMYTIFNPPKRYRPPTSVVKPGCTLGCVQCAIRGQKVEVLYWPVKTVLDEHNLTITITPTTTGIVTANVRGHTLTSPTIYLSYDILSAENNCGQVGANFTSGILPIPLNETLSSFGYRRRYHSQMPTMSFNFADLNEPLPLSIYQKQFDCGYNATETCPIVIPGNYNPSVVLPRAVRSLDPLWADCANDWIGVFDPPHALQTVEVLIDPSTLGAIQTNSAQPGTAPLWDGPTATTEPQNDNPPSSKTSHSDSPALQTGSSWSPSVAISVGDSHDGSQSPARSFVQPEASATRVVSSVKETGYSLSVNGDGDASFVPSNDPTPSLDPVTLFGTTISATSGMYVIGGYTASAGGVAITVSGTRISVLRANDGIVVGSSTRTFSVPSQPPMTLHSAGVNVWVVNGHTLSPGREITVNGTRLSLSPSSFLVVLNAGSNEATATSSPSRSANTSLRSSVVQDIFTGSATQVLPYLSVVLISFGLGLFSSLGRY